MQRRLIVRITTFLVSVATPIGPSVAASAASHAARATRPKTQTSEYMANVVNAVQARAEPRLAKIFGGLR